MQCLSISRTHPDGLKAQSPHSAVGHLDDPGDLCVGSIHLVGFDPSMHPRSRLGGVVPEEEDGQLLGVLGGDAILEVVMLLHCHAIHSSNYCL